MEMDLLRYTEYIDLEKCQFSPRSGIVYRSIDRFRAASAVAVAHRILHQNILWARRSF